LGRNVLIEGKEARAAEKLRQSLELSLAFDTTNMEQTEEK
jgi:hypothetical protein